MERGKIFPERQRGQRCLKISSSVDRLGDAIGCEIILISAGVCLHLRCKIRISEILKERESGLATLAWAMPVSCWKFVRLN